jgi:hypothetical protein
MDNSLKNLLENQRPIFFKMAKYEMQLVYAIAITY